MNKKVKKRWIKALISIILLIAVLNNLNYIFFKLNPTKRIKLDYTIQSVEVENMDEMIDLYSDSDIYSIKDLVIEHGILLSRAVAVHLNPEKYIVVDVSVNLKNNTDYDVYDWDYCVKKNLSVCSVAVYKLDSPVFMPLLVGEETVQNIMFITPKKYFEKELNSQEKLKEIVNSFQIEIRAADLNKSKTYKDLYRIEE